MKKTFKRVAALIGAFVLVFAVGFCGVGHSNKDNLSASAESYLYPDNDSEEFNYVYMYGSYYLKTAEFDIYGKFGANYYWLNYDVFFSVALEPYLNPEEVAVAPYVGQYVILRCTRQAGTLQNTVITYVDYCVRIDMLADRPAYEISDSDVIGGSLKPNGSVATDLSRLGFFVLVQSDNYQVLGEFSSFEVDYFAKNCASLGMSNSEFFSSDTFYGVGVRFSASGYNLYVFTDNYFEPEEGIEPVMPYQFLTDYGVLYNYSDELISAPSLSIDRVGPTYSQAEYRAYGASEFERGLSQGLNAVGGSDLSQSVKGFIFSLFDAPVNTFMSVFDMEYEGFDIGGLAALILTGAVIAAVVKILL